MTKKILLAIPLLLIFMVSISGVAYAMWCDSVLFTGEVNTATFCAVITKVTNSDPYQPDGVYSNTYDAMTNPESCTEAVDWVEVTLDKNVGWATAAIDPQDPKMVNFAVWNAYPGYTVTFGVDITNCGTLPWNVTQVDFYCSNGTSIGTLYQQGILSVDFDGDGKSDINIRWNDNFGVQVHKPNAAEISWNLKIMEWAPQDAHFDFYAVIKICAFNAIANDVPPPIFD